jgi:hypothetical protein
MSEVATLAAEQPAVLGVLPGWGIAADLIPPELINARRLKVIRRLLAAGVGALLVICAGGYYLAAQENASASSALASVQDRTAQLEGVGRGYADLVTIQGSIRQVRAQIAQLMTGDVDLAALMGELRSNLPATMTITDEAVTVSVAGVAGADSSTAASGLDTSGLPRIGTVTITGTGQSVDDLPDYIDRLNSVTGLVDVLPVANTLADPSGTDFTVTMGLTSALLSHRFDVGG